MLTEEQKKFVMPILNISDFGMESVPHWFRQVRAHARDLILQEGLPDSTDESWKYTPLTKLYQNSLTSSHSVDVGANSVINELLNVSKYKITFIDGKIALSQGKNIFPGIDILSLDEALSQFGDQLSDFFEKASRDDSFSQLNDAVFSQATVFVVSEKWKDTDLIHIENLHSGEGSFSSFPRYLFLVQKKSKIQILESYQMKDQRSSSGFSCPVTDFVVEENACVDYTRVVYGCSQHINFGYARVVQKESSRFNSTSFVLGGNLTREMMNVSVFGENTFTSLSGIMIGRAEQVVDQQTRIQHLMPNQTSRQLFKTILSDHSRGVFNGLIKVARGAPRTDAEQLNKNLLLSKTARIDAKPGLEIDVDDVKCKHGATIGQLSKEELFYFQSRAISSDIAQSMMIAGFAGEVLHKIKHVKLRDELIKILQNKDLYQ